MAKHWCVTSFAALVLLCSLVGNDVEAQGAFSKGGPPPMTPPKNPPHMPQTRPPRKPMDPQFISPPIKPSPQKPQVMPPSNPKLPRPQTPQVPRPQTPQVPRPQTPQVPRPQTPQVPRPQTPQVTPPQTPQISPFSDSGNKMPQNPGFYTPQVLPPSNPLMPQAPGSYKPQVMPPSNPLMPMTPPLYQNPKDYLGYDKGIQKPPPASPPKKGPSTPQDPKDLAMDQRYQTPQIPYQKPQTPIVSPVPPPKSCEVDRHVRVHCGVPGISADACEAIDCCFDGHQCYFGTGVTVQCTKDGHFIVVVAREVTLPNIDLETISLLGEGQSCTHVDSNSAFAIYYFGVTECGSVVMEEPGAIIYENRMTSSYEVGVGPLGAITRDSSYELLFQCRYIGTSIETLVAEVLPLDNPPLPVAAFGPLRVHLRLANGQCSTKGCNEVDVAYTSYFMDSDYPVTKVLREPVYVEVQLLDKTDPSLVLTLGRCWATTTPSPHSLPQWDILIDGCPYRDDRYLSALIPVDQSSGLDFPSHYRRFLFKMFTFVDPHSMEPLREHVYIHCSTAVCVPGPHGSCEPHCFRRKRDTQAAAEAVVEPKVVVSSGEVIMTAAAAEE